MHLSTARLVTREFMDRFLDAQHAVPCSGERAVMPGVAIRQEAFAAFVQLKSAVLCRNMPDVLRYARRLRGDPEFGVLARVHVKRALFARAISESRRYGRRIEECPACDAPNAVPLDKAIRCAGCSRELQPALAGAC